MRALAEGAVVLRVAGVASLVGEVARAGVAAAQVAAVAAVDALVRVAAVAAVGDALVPVAGVAQVVAASPQAEWAASAQWAWTQATRAPVVVG